MNALFPQEEIELKMLVQEESDRESINDIIINYPVTWDIDREMLMSGLSTNNILLFCKELHFKGKIISDVWNNVKGISTIRNNNKLI